MDVVCSELGNGTTSFSVEHIFVVMYVEWCSLCNFVVSDVELFVDYSIVYVFHVCCLWCRVLWCSLYCLMVCGWVWCVLLIIKSCCYSGVWCCCYCYCIVA